MKRLLAICAALAAAIPATSAQAQYNLTPVEEGDPYDAVLDHAFAEARDGRAVAQAIITPNYGPERSVSVHRIGQRYTLRVLEPTRFLWPYARAAMYADGHVRLASTSSAEEEAAELARERAEILEGLPQDPADVRLDRCERPLARQTGQLIETVWPTMTRTARPDTPEEDENTFIYLHATSYRYWSRDAEGEATGDRYGAGWGAVSAMAEIAHQLADLCEGRVRERAVERNLRELAADLAERLDLGPED
jgi:hypothetical protein